MDFYIIGITNQFGKFGYLNFQPGANWIFLKSLGSTLH